MQLQPLARLVPVTSAINSGCGIFVRSQQATRLLQLQYSFVDVAQKFGVVATSVSFASRIVAMVGQYAGDPTQFTINTDLSTYLCPIDHFISDLGPSNILLSGDADETLIESGIGFTLLLAAPSVAGVSGTQFVAKLIGTSNSIADDPNARALHITGNAPPNGSAAAPSGGSGGTGGGSGGGTGSGGYGGGGYDGGAGSGHFPNRN